MREETKSMSEWVDQHLAERRFARAARAMIRAGHYPTDVKRSWPQAAATPKAAKTFDQSKLPPAELPENPTMADIAKQLGVKPKELQQATGDMSLDQLMRLFDVDGVNQLVDRLGMIIRNQPKGLTKFEAMRVAVAKARLHGDRLKKLLKLERAKAARAEALKRHQAVTKRS